MAAGASVPMSLAKPSQRERKPTLPLIPVVLAHAPLAATVGEARLADGTMGTQLYVRLRRSIEMGSSLGRERPLTNRVIATTIVNEDIKSAVIEYGGLKACAFQRVRTIRNSHTVATLSARMLLMREGENENGSAI